MHLGRFHRVVWDLVSHFEHANLHEKFEATAAALDNYASNKDPGNLAAFQTALGALIEATAVADADLFQPYAQEVIEEMDIAWALGAKLAEHAKAIVANNGFDQAGISAGLRAESKKLKTLFDSLNKITTAFNDLSVEYEHVDDEKEESEVGLLIPREVVGDTIPLLTAEFDHLGRLSRAISELTGAENYDAPIRTISSSEWQIFLSLTPDQILVWVLALERIVGLFKSNIEIKNLQKLLSDQQIPKTITDQIEAEIEKRMAKAIDSLAKEIVTKHATKDLKLSSERKSELSNQLRFELRHLAKRLNQGAQVEINIGVPEDPKEPAAPADGESPDAGVAQQIAAQRKRIEDLRALRTRGLAATQAVATLKSEEQVLLPYLQAEEAEPGNPKKAT